MGSICCSPLHLSALSIFNVFVHLFTVKVFYCCFHCLQRFFVFAPMYMTPMPFCRRNLLLTRLTQSNQDSTRMSESSSRLKCQDSFNEFCFHRQTEFSDETETETGLSSFAEYCKPQTTRKSVLAYRYQSPITSNNHR